MIIQGWPSCSGTLSKFIPALSFLGLRCKMRVFSLGAGGCCAGSSLLLTAQLFSSCDEQG